MRILIVGNGWIGTRLADLFSRTDHHCEAISWRHMDSVLRTMSEPWDIVVNAVGKTGRPNVDWCEDHREETADANVIQAESARIVYRRAELFIHLSSGCLWESGTDIDEGAMPRPCSYYGLTKAAGEMVMGPDAVIARVRMPFDCLPHERNLLAKLARYDNLITGRNSLTSIKLLARFILAKPAPGIWNVVHTGSMTNIAIRGLMTKYNLANYEFDMISPAELLAMGLARAPRSVCTLSTDKLRGLIAVPNVNEAIEEAIAEMASNEG